MKRGFTLIELSIVLVIIGLIVGGILTGKDLIEAAQEQRMLRDLEAIKRDFNTFRLKYNCLPGDCANASQMISDLSAYEDVSGNANNPDGNGNSRIDTGWEGGLRMWEQLSKSGIMPGSYSGQWGTGYQPGVNWPRFGWLEKKGWLLTDNATINLSITEDYACIPDSFAGCESNQPMVSDGTVGIPGRAIVIGAIGSYVVANPFMAGFRCDLAYRLDKKIDDGMPAAGRVRAWGSGLINDNCMGVTFNAGGGIPASTTYTNTDPNAFGSAWRYAGMTFGF